MIRDNLKGLCCAALLMTACGRTDVATRPSHDTGSGATDRAEPAMAAAPTAEAAVPDQLARAVVGLASPAAPMADRMIVRTATLSLQVADVRKATDAIARATLAANGFLGTSRLWRDGAQEHATMTIRVPAPALEATLASLRGLAVRVDDEAVTGEDVTRQAVDLRAQLTNLRATEVELRALLVTVRQKTGKASEVLEVHAELSRIRGEIERADAELQSLSQLAALSTINLDLRPDVVATPIASDSWQPRGVVRDASRALLRTMQTATNAAIWAAIYVVPLLLLVALPVGLVWRERAQRRRARAL